MRILAAIALIVAFMVGAAILWFPLNYPGYSSRYRLTVAIETDGKIHTGSSVIEVRWAGQPYIQGAGSYFPRIFGQAAVIDLGPKGAVVATLNNGELYGIAPDGAVDAAFLAARAFGNGSTYEELPQLPQLIGRRELNKDNLPRFIWLANPADPSTARKLTAEEIPALLGPTARLSAAYVEITRDPIVVDIQNKLPWYPELERRQKYRSVLSRPGEFQLVYNMFVGDGS